ncbi:MULTISPECIES: 30S ribosomal protein S20 [Hahella]|uniref:Small ribosomal subunit protein bS20 n=1 Tax=Hahella chejuensis (strain KCTC 2396) TaxID=349521 RepID=RS20_HAHCH|nr:MULTISPECIES: 30S ribosomal protein S20 [Hahella]Q2S9T5.1 RecName: Full=Small ribosomal subunit protein bS20; AltName: Full=30S ribosomal protein S20 [Hahella chejuensis KCTC 2396]MBU6955328.1 30S ribosomal protein S20 [Hahella sp. HN01]ABC32589.1 ribosomal protein S20 [Hahella chejuensis KCTC 2396]AZZ94370.1 30S ribosomal protein S20 [Hahella sp. KA22]MDG9670382.1 30S ribosomal protein S20 [Hahella sp. CR1]QAY57744.1 30S ribosomal protein S20 [Hahella sp. KA22]
MANNPSSKKRARQQVKRRAHNMSLRSMVRTYIKKVSAQIEQGSYDGATQALTTAAPIIDSMVNKGIFSKNKAARTKSRLNAKIKALKAS